jgi:hypothetical protein
LGKAPGRSRAKGTAAGGLGSARGTIAAGLCALGLLAGAHTVHAQVSVPGVSSLPQAPSVPVPAAPPLPAPPKVEAPAPPPVSLPEPVQRALPAPPPSPGGGAGGSLGGAVSQADDVVRSGAGRVLGTGGPASGEPGGGGSVPGGSASGGSGAGGPGAGAGLGPALGGSGSGAAAAGAGGRGARPGAAGGGRGDRARSPSGAAERAARRRAVERRRGRFVRRLRGCIDRLPPMQRATLILRYGVGPVRPRSGEQAARLLDVSRSRVRVLERKGLRALARIDEGASCAATGVSQTTLAGVYELLTDWHAADVQALPTPLEAGVQLVIAAAAMLDDGEGEGAVAGVRESAGERRSASSGDPEEDGPVASAGPALDDPFGEGDSAMDDPLLLALLALVVACLVSAGREVGRALR